MLNMHTCTGSPCTQLEAEEMCEVLGLCSHSKASQVETRWQNTHLIHTSCNIVGTL